MDFIEEYGAEVEPGAVFVRDESCVCNAALPWENMSEEQYSFYIRVGVGFYQHRMSRALFR